MARKKLRVEGSLLTFSVVIYKERDLYVAWSPEFDIACQGDTIEEASNDLDVAIKLYMTYQHAKYPKTDFDFVAVSPRVMKLSNEKLKA